MSYESTTALSTKPATQPPWLSILPVTLRSHGLRCRDQTPASAQRLVSLGQLAAEDFLEKSPDIERTLLDAFIEDDFDGKLHLTTLSTSGSAGCASEGEEMVLGLAFWREVPSDEMGDWMDLRRISKAIAGAKLDPDASSEPNNDERDLSRNARDAMNLVRSDSVTWIHSALRTRTRGGGGEPSLGSSVVRELTHAWVKIELVAIRRAHRGHRLGMVLLGCTLAEAHALHRNERAVLHIAGGGASRNVPAARLYARYGFVPVPKHEDGGPFVKPDRDLFVLGNIGMALSALPWEEVMQLTDD